MINFKELEEKILAQWEQDKTFEKSLENRKDAPHFVFYEGPPTANGRPGIHHVPARAFKDIICRYKTMAGFFVSRKAGWDTHGLPVELEVEKKLGLKSKKDIEQYGIAAFNQKCRESVWTYKDEWEKLTRRMGFWLDLAHPYITYDPNYMESLWWIIKQVWEKDLLYKGHKVVPFCTRCGTGLSSHEVAQGYKEVTENSVYVKFKLEPGQKIGEDFITDDYTYILSWTTTPWTLPGNVALAVGENIEYAVIEQNAEKFILAKDLASRAFPSPLKGEGEDGVDSRVKPEDDKSISVSGRVLVGLTYKPLFDIPALKTDTAYKIYAADFVTTTTGTGVVHTAVMYGEDDYNLGVKVGLPQHHTVTEQGKFTNEVKELAGLYVKDKKTEEKIISYLKEKGFLLREEPYTHDYPFCWRCDSPLLYYAKPSWFIAMSKLRDKLIANNTQVNWIPEHMQEGRFGEWLKEVKDWNFSRERYWGTPLPIWQCEKCDNLRCLGSLEELNEAAWEKSGNEYYIMRHAQATSNLPPRYISHYVEEDKKNPAHLTELGQKQAAEAAEKIKKLSITRIISSDFTRTQETAEIVGRDIGVVPEFDRRLWELDHGHGFHGKTVVEYLAALETPNGTRNRFTQKPLSGGENLNEVRERMMACVRDLEKKYRNEKILVVSHGDPLWMLEMGTRLVSDEAEMQALREKEYIDNAEVRFLPFKNLPYDEAGYLNLHRPYIDDFTLRCSSGSCNGKMTRVKELCDVWFDSGSMPFAQAHYPFEFKEEPSTTSSEVVDLSAVRGGREERKPSVLNCTRLSTGALNEEMRQIHKLAHPADYISEAIDQTRGWFYTLLAVSTLLDKGAPYKNVISLAHVLDAKGQKMSKSKGNAVNPWDMIEKYGIDALRWYFFTVNDPGDYKLFDEKHVAERLRGFLNTFWNCVVFYKTYSRITNYELRITDKTHVLDKWILSVLNKLVCDVRKKLDAYDVTGAARLIERFVIDDFSQWYVRRSRDRLQTQESSMAVCREVLASVAQLVAPFIPFVAEAAWGELNDSRFTIHDVRSVHLENFPSVGEIDEQLIQAMGAVRQDASTGLALRASSNIKIRQPLTAYTSAVLERALLSFSSEAQKQFKDVLAEELNVKEITFGKEAALDTYITEELKLEGAARDLIRQIQDARKKSGLKPGEEIILTVGEEVSKNLLEHPLHGPAIKSKTFIKEWKSGAGSEFRIGKE